MHRVALVVRSSGPLVVAVAEQFGADAAIFKGNASYALVAEFESEEDLKVYARHPEHQALLADLAGPMLESFQSVQFVVD